MGLQRTEPDVSSTKPVVEPDEVALPPTLFGFVNRYSWRQQVIVTILALASFPFLYVSLELPKQIVNNAINGKVFPQTLFGIPFGQIDYLILLSVGFLLLVLVNGAFKLQINTYKGRVGERMLRRMRQALYNRMLRFPSSFFAHTAPGEIVPMITSETEALGGFIGDSYSLPLLAGGQLAVTLAFMLIQDPILGTAAIALYPFQIYLIPKLQNKVNALSKERTRLMRSLSDRINETAITLPEIQSNAGGRWQRADFSHRLWINYQNRFSIYQWKFFIKFLNNFIAQLTPFFFYLIGGYLVIKGDLSFGSLVAALAAYKDLGPLWRELLDYYQSRADAIIKYDLIVEQFAPPGLIPADRLAEPEGTVLRGEAEIAAQAVSLADSTGYRSIDNLSLTVGPGDRVAIVGSNGVAPGLLTHMMSGLLDPSSGRILLDGKPMNDLSRATVARRIGFVPQTIHLFAGTVRDNLVYGLWNRPQTKPDAREDAAQRRRRNEALISGDSTEDPTENWIDLESFWDGNGSAAEAFNSHLHRVLTDADLISELRELGLRRSIDPEKQPELAEIILNARQILYKTLSEPRFEGYYAPFEREKFNEQASLAENLLFGTPVGPSFDLMNLAGSACVRKTLVDLGLWTRFVDVGSAVARTMLEIFEGLPPGHPILVKYSFVDGQELADYEAAVTRRHRAGQHDMLSEEEQIGIVSILLRLVPARHRLDEIDEQIRSDIMAARARFAEILPASEREAIEFYDPERYNRTASLRDNLLFGRVAPGQDGPGGRIRQVVLDALQAAGQLETVLGAIVEVGLTYHAGVGGARLSPELRQKVALARALLKRPDLLILNDPFAALDLGAQSRLIEAVLKGAGQRPVIWTLQRPSLARLFDRVVVMDNGHIVDQGSYDEVETRSELFQALVRSE